MIGLPEQPTSNLIKATQERVRGDLNRHAKEAIKISTAKEEWLKWRKEAINWAFLAKIHGGSAVETYKQIKQKEDEAYQKMQIAENELEKVKHPLPPVPAGLRGNK